MSPSASSTPIEKPATAGVFWQLNSTIVESEFCSMFNDKAGFTESMYAAGYGHRIGSGLATVDQTLAAYKAASNASNKPTELHRIIKRVEVARESITIDYDRSALVDWLAGTTSSQVAKQQTNSLLSRITRPIVMKRRGVETRMVVANARSLPDRFAQSLIQLIAKATCYLDSLTAAPARTLSDVAQSIRPNFRKSVAFCPWRSCRVP